MVVMKLYLGNKIFVLYIKLLFVVVNRRKYIFIYILGLFLW